MNKVTSAIVICTRNRPVDILYAISSISQQTELPQEFIIVDSSESKLSDNKQFIKAFAQDTFPQTKCVYKHTTTASSSYQRNVGARLATTDVLHFVDDDSILQPDYIKEMNCIFTQNKKYGGGMGSVTNIPPKKHDWTRVLHSIFLLQKLYASGKFRWSGWPTHAYGCTEFKEVEVLGGCCMAYRREVFLQHLFDEKLGRYAYMEDCDLSCRVSYAMPLFYNPKAKMQHMSSPVARDGMVERKAIVMKNYSYLFFKNIYPRNRLKIIFYCWSLLGLFLEAAIARNIDYIKGYIIGLRRFTKRH